MAHIPAPIVVQNCLTHRQNTRVTAAGRALTGLLKALLFLRKTPHTEWSVLKLPAPIVAGTLDISSPMGRKRLLAIATALTRSPLILRSTRKVRPPVLYLPQ